MNFLLKIVEGPNRGAEIALVEGVAITLGKGDDCDVILADATMPDAPLSIAVSDEKVLVGGEELPPFNVRTFGSTSFAVGPSDSPWRDLVWPKKEEAKVEPAEEPAGEDIPPVEPEAAPEEPKEDPAVAEPTKKSRVGCLIVLVAILLLLGAAGWFFRAPLLGFFGRVIGGRPPAAADSGEASSLSSLEAIAERYGLVLSEEDGVERLSGNLSTRALRLRATAEAYAAKPGILVDLSDDQSFRVSAEDALFTLTEGVLKVVSATNRVLAISGSVRSADTLKKVLVALAADMPKLRDVDVSGVEFSGSAPLVRVADGEEDESSSSVLSVSSAGLAKAVKDRKAAPSKPLLPVCGILTMPYPCLVMRDGSRVMEGASLGGNVIMKIEADAVTVTNAVGRFTWKP